MQWTNWIESLEPGRAAGSPKPHKPLLLVYLLARAAAGCPNEVSFKVVLDEFMPWLGETPGIAKPEPRLPFWHLKGDYEDSWRIEPPTGYEMQKGRPRPKKSSLLARGARGAPCRCHSRREMFDLIQIQTIANHSFAMQKKRKP